MSGLLVRNVAHVCKFRKASDTDSGNGRTALEVAVCGLGGNEFEAGEVAVNFQH